MDAYYAQAEMIRLNISKDKPLAVQQWHGLLAINYVARKFGISRDTLAKDAKKLCPEIILPHVDTFYVDKDGKMIETSLEHKFEEHDRYLQKKKYFSKFID